MDTWDAYRSRRNVRNYDTRPIPAASLDRILDAGRRAPSAFNSQPWDFVVVTESGALGELATVWQGAGHVARSAATIVVVTPEQPDVDKARWSEFDLGQAIMAMAIVAADLGIGSAHALIGDQQRCRQLLDIPAANRCAYLLALGYPAGGPLAPLGRLNRRPFEQVVHREHW
jgi:nitroreductase